jgi:hypothetical protein
VLDHRGIVVTVPVPRSTVEEPMEPAADSTPIACSLSQGDLTSRLRRWHALADRSIIDAAPTGSGLRLRFRNEPGVEAELADLAALERDCCAFADWAVRADSGSVTVDVRGKSAESVPVVQEMFTSLSSRAPRQSG